MTDDQITRTARDLSELIALSAALEAQAIAKANSPDHLPGGAAMVALGPVGDRAEWDEIVEAAEWHHYAKCDRQSHDKCFVSPAEDDEEDWYPPLQTLLFWSSELRREQGQDYGQHPTIISEASYLKFALDHLWATEPRFEDFAHDIEVAKDRLENLLLAGKRSQRGVQCFDCNVDLVRPTRDPRKLRECEGHDGVCGYPHKFCPHDRGGLADEWYCPKCERRYDVEAYRRAVSHAHFVYADYLPLGDCSERTGVKPGTIKVWVTRGHVRKHRDEEAGRMTYCVADVEARNTEDEAVA